MVWRYTLLPTLIFLNEQKSKDAAAKKRPNTSGVGKIDNYNEDTMELVYSGHLSVATIHIYRWPVYRGVLCVCSAWKIPLGLSALTALCKVTALRR